MLCSWGMAADEHPLFRSTEHDGPFPRCCSCSLPFDEVPYQVSKHFKKDEPIIEFAICLDCNMNLVEEFSEESKAAAQRFYTTELTFSHHPSACVKSARRAFRKDSPRRPARSVMVSWKIMWFLIPPRRVNCRLGQSRRPF